MINALLAVCVICLLALIVRFVLPEAVYSLRDSVIDARIEKAFLEAETQKGKGDLFPLLLARNLRYVSVDAGFRKVLWRITKIREVYRMCDLRGPRKQLHFKRGARAQRVCLGELASMLSDIAIRMEVSAKFDGSAIPASRILGFLILANADGFGGMKPRIDPATEAEFRDLAVPANAGRLLESMDIETWFAENPISMEQAAELVIAAIYALSLRREATPGDIRE